MEGMDCNTIVTSTKTERKFSTLRTKQKHQGWGAFLCALITYDFRYLQENQ